VVTSIVFDPRDSQSVWASAWTQDSAEGGGVYHSEDGSFTTLLVKSYAR
jgi:hypothetical protein